MVELEVRTSGGEYPLFIGRHIYEDHLGRDLERMAAGKTLIVSHPMVFEMHGRRLGDVLAGATEGGRDHYTFLFPAGEENKNLKTVREGYLALIEGGFTREDMILAFGGGVVGDLAGFLAATYMRGIMFVQLPTTLMAMVDSSIGGKVGVDLPNAKNAVGAFHQPKGVYSDTDVLVTLPERELRSGLVEVVKYGLLYDAELLLTIAGWPDGVPDPAQGLDDIIATCAAHKARVVAVDERDTNGIRAMLNYGHTFGHALESAGGYDLLRHGEAVGVGMIAAARLAELAGLTAAGLYEKHLELLLPVMGEFEVPEGLVPERVLAHMRSDKKRGKELRFVLLEGPQAPRLVEGIPDEKVERALMETLQGIKGV